MPATRKSALLDAGAALPVAPTASARGEDRAEFDLPAISSPTSQKPARLVVAPPLPEALARGLVVIQYHAENLRIVPVFGPGALTVIPRIGHLHVTVDDAPWHWVDASGEPLIIQSLTPGPHRVLIELADPTHHVSIAKPSALKFRNGRVGSNLASDLRSPLR